MKIIDASNIENYNQLIPAIVGYCDANVEEDIRVIMTDKHSFKDLKNYLLFQKIGFREVYSGEQLILEFKKK